MESKNSSVKTINRIIQGLVFLLPVFFLPITSSQLGMDNFNKANLLYLSVAVILLILAILSRQRPELALKSNFLDIFLFSWVIGLLISVFLGLDPAISLWGAFGALGLPVMAMIALSAFYWALSNNFNSINRPALVRSAIYANALAVLALSLAFLAVAAGLLPPESRFFELARLAVGNTEQLAVYLSALAVLLAGIFLFEPKGPGIFRHKPERIAAILTLIIDIALIMIINFVPAWICLLAGMAVLLAFYSYAARGTSSLLNIGFFGIAAIFLVAVFFIIINNIMPGNGEGQRLAKRLQVSWGATAQTALSSLSARPITGFGPEMFGPAYSLFRPAEQNSSPYWYVRFNRGSSFWWEQLIAGGLVGLAVFSAFWAAAFYLSLKAGLYALRSAPDVLSAVFSAVIISLLTALVVFSVNLVLAFYLFLLLGLTAGYYKFNIRSKTFVYSRQNLPKQYNALVTAGFILAAFFIMLNVYAWRNFAAAAYYYAGNRAGAGDAENLLRQAAGLNPSYYQYSLALAGHYRKKALNILASGNKDFTQAQAEVNQAINWAKRSIETAPYAVAPREALGMIYRDLSEFSRDTGYLALSLLKEAGAREPSNPVLPMEMGKVYLELNSPQEAIAALELARSLKPEYYSINFNLAKAYAAAGQGEKALAALESLAEENNSVELYYQLGRINFNLKRYEAAIRHFNSVVEAEPLHANALYSLGLAYSAVGEVEEALHYLNKVKQLNPDSELLEETIEGVRE